MNREIITVWLDSVRQCRNTSEYRTVNRATCGDIVSVGDGNNIVKVLTEAHAQGTPDQAVVHVRRGDTLCFKPTPLKSWVNRPSRTKAEAA